MIDNKGHARAILMDLSEAFYIINYVSAYGKDLVKKHLNN